MTLVFGMLVIVPPQLYVELVTRGELNPGYLSFYAEYLNLNTDLATYRQTPLGLLTWGHLWFLPYLFIYSVIIIALMPVFRRIASLGKSGDNSAPGFTLCVMVVLGACWWVLKPLYPSTHDLVNDWYNHGKYFIVMLAGVWLALRPALWASLVRFRRVFLLSAVVCYSLIIMDRHDWFDEAAAPYENALWLQVFITFVVMLNHWGWILAIVGYGSEYLSKPSTVIQKLNRAVLPYYLFHQTLIIVFAYWLMPVNLPVWIEVAILIVGVVAGCHVGYRIVDATPGLRALSGLKKQKASESLCNNESRSEPEHLKAIS